jgi:pentose-5-phosphate-3-epimerase
LNKIQDLKDYISLRNLDVKIHVDGNVSIKNIPTMVKNGGDTLISGSSGMFLKDLNLVDSIKGFKEAINIGLNA